ncbi:MAG: phosphatase [Stygiobacter sp. RIFOXYC12_FULL_38_8]|nr:MAG: phosphatase [Stygiobacter sp. RIFOXYA12_FULL_38_9]OGV07368.1 MAG: phosphatase [Stygiobacter sp. RIFOXYB2_FULL_37_11]OGV16183.1 MAG: phosphatase [Stygiobacter sp. RIFOXYC2_FULL_38_25]OGV17412.1 MAG: phosphatase [Stygiobacter sp. RIFOXYA2_FULL_38_8]OGV27701.1 MAG: phosphatase [Stygiobacter sp. RIFOXYC12_FULL_38_8]OGV81723.1 MAG: phosphatase [Stygiobacter sp. GWF2_38_21]
MLRNFDGFIFDVDGTLTSTNELIFSSFNHVTQKYLNKRVSNEEIIAMFGPTEDVILQEWMKHDYQDARKDYFDFYSSQHQKMADIYPGMIDVLKFIKSKSIPLSIYTGKGKDSARITLKEIGVYDLFDLIVTGDDVKESKPSREGVDMFVEKFNLDRNKVLMIGDAPADVIAAHRAGVKAASVLWDSYARDKVLQMNSDYVFETVEEFMKFLEENI